MPQARLFSDGVSARLREQRPLDRSQVLMIFRPAGRFFTGPRPPAVLAARVLAAVIRPPLLFFAIWNLCFVGLFDG